MAESYSFGAVTFRLVFKPTLTNSLLIIASDLVRHSAVRWYAVPWMAGTCQCSIRERNEGGHRVPRRFRRWRPISLCACTWKGLSSGKARGGAPSPSPQSAHRGTPHRRSAESLAQKRVVRTSIRAFNRRQNGVSCRPLDAVVVIERPIELNCMFMPAVRCFEGEVNLQKQ